MLKSKMLSYSLCIFNGELVAHSPSVSFADSSLYTREPLCEWVWALPEAFVIQRRNRR